MILPKVTVGLSRTSRLNRNGMGKNVLPTELVDILETLNQEKKENEDNEEEERVSVSDSENDSSDSDTD